MKTIFCYHNTLCMLALCIAGCDSMPQGPQSAAKVAEPSAVRGNPSPAQKLSARPVHWTYAGKSGPEHWSSLSPMYAACGRGQLQSPINLLPSEATGKAKLAMEYKTTSLHMAHNEHVDDIVDNGHTIQINVEPGSTISVNGKVFSLKQGHFHTPSEHTFSGKHFPMEMHLVHQSADGAFAVIGVLLEKGEANADFAKIIEHLPNAPGEDKHVPDMHLNITAYLPKNTVSYHYRGSLTTPPCSENVHWFVLQSRLALSTEQLKAFESRLRDNHRPTQALNGRKIAVDRL